MLNAKLTRFYLSSSTLFHVNEDILLVESIMKVLAELQRHAPSHPMLSSLIGAMHIPDKVKAMNSISIDRLFSERNENFEGLQLRPMLPSQRTNTVYGVFVLIQNSIEECMIPIS